VCVCVWETEREIMNDADVVDAAANADVVVVTAHAEIADVDLVVDDVALAANATLVVDPITDAAWGAAPPKAN